jgi:hypothetical protein
MENAIEKTLIESENDVSACAPHDFESVIDFVLCSRRYYCSVICGASTSFSSQTFLGFPFLLGSQNPNYHLP